MFRHDRRHNPRDRRHMGASFVRLTDSETPGYLSPDVHSQLAESALNAAPVSARSVHAFLAAAGVLPPLPDDPSAESLEAEARKNCTSPRVTRILALCDELPADLKFTVLLVAGWHYLNSFLVRKAYPDCEESFRALLLDLDRPDLAEAAWSILGAHMLTDTLNHLREIGDATGVPLAEAFRAALPHVEPPCELA